MSRYTSLTTPATRGAAPPMQAPQPPPAAPGMWRDMPTRALSVRSDVGVPLLWALVSGLLVGVGLWYLSRDVDAALGIGGLVTLIVWPLGIWVVIRSLTAHEWPQDPPAPWFPPDEQERGGTLVLNAEHGRAEYERVEHEDKLQLFWAFLVECEDGNTDWRYWQERRDAAGKRLVTDRQYRQWRDALFAAGFAAQDNPGQATSRWHLTRPAADIYRRASWWPAGGESE